MDREKVINQIEVDIQRTERTGEMLVHVGRKTAKDALALLKDQDNCENCAIAVEDRQLVVRCKDCDNKECWGRAGDVVCGIDGTPHRPDWFCADGKRMVSA